MRNFGGPGSRDVSREDGLEPNVERLKKILGGDVKELNAYAEELAKKYVSGGETEKLSTSQIRSVLDEIQRMREFDHERLQLLRPKLAYAAGRHGGMVRYFQELMDLLINMTTKDNYQYFKNFVEAIVAYHRYHGGK